MAHDYRRAIPAPLWYWRFMYDRESAALQRRRDEPEQREFVNRMVDELSLIHI